MTMNKDGTDASYQQPDFRAFDAGEGERVETVERGVGTVEIYDGSDSFARAYDHDGGGQGDGELHAGGFCD